MIGDIIQDQRGGWFYRDNGDSTYDNLSDLGGGSPATALKVSPSIVAMPITLVRGGKSTNLGDALATRVAVVMARRYA